jgi:ADP-ribose pyrophosphatase
MAFERTGGEEVWRGRIASVRVDSFRFDDGEEVTREIVEHPGAVAIVAHDDERLFMVAQPREAVGEQRLLELPAGKLDDGEDPLATARRELAEEIGKGARSWRHLTTFYSSAGFSNEQMHLYLATDLYDQPTQAEENERIEIEAVPLGRLDDTIRGCRDAKTLVGLLWLRAFGNAGA